MENRLHAVLLSVLALPSEADFARHATLLHLVIAPYLDQKAAQILSLGGGQNITTTQNGSNVPLEALELAVLAVFSKLAKLQPGPPIDLQTLHDFIVVYLRPSISKQERLVARNVVSLMFRKRPSLLKGFETQICPAYIQMMQECSEIKELHWLQRASALCFSIRSITQLNAVQDILIHSAIACTFWTAFQAFYDTVLPNKFSGSLGANQPSEHSQTQSYILLRQSLLQIFLDHVTKLSIEALLSLIEGEADSPDLPDNLTTQPYTSMINLSLLGDAEFHFVISDQIGTNIGEQELDYIKNSLRSLLPAGQDVDNGLNLVGKGKDKGKARLLPRRASIDNTVPVGGDILQQILAILPDTALESVQRILASPNFASLDDSKKVELAVQTLLEGDTVENLDLDTDNTSISHNAGQLPRQTQGKSSFAMARSNVFDDRLDLSRAHLGKQDILNDAYLPSELKAAIMNAAAAQDEQDEQDLISDEGDSGPHTRTAAFADEYDDSDNHEIIQRNGIRVKDNVDEESEAEDEEERGREMEQRDRDLTMPSHKWRERNRDSQPPSPSVLHPSSSHSSFPPHVESLLLSRYFANSLDFSRESRKASTRALLKKDSGGLSDEQIEGWATMLARNPNKDKILKDAGEFKGNIKGLEVKPQTSRQGPKQELGKMELQGAEQATRDGAARGRGRGRGRGVPGTGGRGTPRGRGQSDQRRRGHDKKVAKTGI